MTRVRSARTGRFAPKGDAKAKPSETVTEGRRRGYQPGPGVRRALGNLHAFAMAYARSGEYEMAKEQRLDVLANEVRVHVMREAERLAAEQKRKARRKAGR